MLKKSASGVLASLRGSTYRSVRLASSLAADLPAERRVLARRGWAGEKSGLFLSILKLFWRQHCMENSSHIFGINRVFPQPAHRVERTVS